jgi:hypothetical protein
MADIINMSQHRPIPPKHVQGIHLHQRYTITFDPNAALHEQWVWQVDFTRTFKYYGSARTLSQAQRQACKRIQVLLNAIVQHEENSDE